MNIYENNEEHGGDFVKISINQPRSGFHDLNLGIRRREFTWDELFALIQLEQRYRHSSRGTE